MYHTGGFLWGGGKWELCTLCLILLGIYNYPKNKLNFKIFRGEGEYKIEGRVLSGGWKVGRNRIEVPVKKLDINKGYNFYFNKQEGGCDQ